MGGIFKLKSKFRPTGDQPEAIEALYEGLRRGEQRLVLRGVTGSGKTFTMANLSAKWNRPTLILSHNQTLAAQLFAELKEFFPENAVESFISYSDYYQPEAYIPQTDTYIEKDAAINEEIERYRRAATNALIARRDVIVVSSVSCIYGLGESDEYRDLAVGFRVGEAISRTSLAARLVEAQYTRNDYDFAPGSFRMRGDVLDVFPAYETKAVRVEFFGDEIDSIRELDPVTGKCGVSLPAAVVTPAKQFVMGKDRFEAAFARIEAELEERLKFFASKGKLLEAQRLRERTEYDIEMMRELGYCNGIENYSRPLTGRAPGTAGECLIDYFPDDFLTIIDESHVSVPQIRAMYNGDQARKSKLVEYGFRLPSAKDNRPLTFDEFNAKVHQVVYCSATPGEYEYSQSKTVAEQVIRPTGLLDPEVEIRPLKGQIDDLIAEIGKVVDGGDRVFVTTLTKRSSEDLTHYLHEAGVRVEYLHSDIDAIERVAILQRLRRGEFDVLVGINLLREGLDLPEVALVAILDADKEGFLRSTTSLVQTAGRTARHERGRVILYADHKTDAIRDLLRITRAHRAKQIAYNKEHGIVPKSVKRAINESSYVFRAGKAVPAPKASPRDADAGEVLEELTREMLEAADNLEFERAAYLRDQIAELKGENRKPGSKKGGKKKGEGPRTLRKVNGHRRNVV
ncbi:MAG: excinuclease ABC subunit UvrB [Kiritimatiellae bacterium]|nr:excinuclease ABC subunit UvrB [Kiritimatiellia bacterium]